MLVTETTGIKLLLKIIVLNPKDGSLCLTSNSSSLPSPDSSVCSSVSFLCRLPPSILPSDSAAGFRRPAPLPDILNEIVQYVKSFLAKTVFQTFFLLQKIKSPLDKIHPSV